MRRYSVLVIIAYITNFTINPLFCQRKVRSDYKNEVFASAYFTNIDVNLYSIGYERTIFIKRDSLKKGRYYVKKKDYFTLQNELTASIFPTFATDHQRLQSLIKWNREKKSIISLGLGMSYRFNTNTAKLSILVNNAYKYTFNKYKMTFTGNIFLLIVRVKPTPPNVFIPGPKSLNNSYSWGRDLRFSASIGKYF